MGEEIARVLCPIRHPPPPPKNTKHTQGYLVGNGCTDAEFDGNALPPFAAGKSLISQVGGCAGGGSSASA